MVPIVENHPALAKPPDCVDCGVTLRSFSDMTHHGIELRHTLLWTRYNGSTFLTSRPIGLCEGINAIQ